MLLPSRACPPPESSRGSVPTNNTYSYCGTTEDYCAAPDCQFNYGPACDANKIPSGANTTTLARTQFGSVAYGGAGIYACAAKGTVALTYDDGPSNYTSDLLDLLKKYNAKATFFITGNNNGKGEIDDTTKPWSAVIKRQYADGHQIASHTWSHADLSALTSTQRKNEMIKNEMALRNILGFIPTYMRPPYSSCTAASGCEDDLAGLGYHIIYFDLDTQDYLHNDPNQIQVSKDTVTNFFQGKTVSEFNALSITHDIEQQTVYNLTEFMLQQITTAGYRTVTVGECLNDPQTNWYRNDTTNAASTGGSIFIVISMNFAGNVSTTTHAFLARSTSEILTASASASPK
jgi:peptidoglycan/xylan/chitin deacetylase (PgdA/CDA1 family)